MRLKNFFDTFFGEKLDYDISQTIIKLFENQVDLNSHREAGEFEDVKLTYRELNKKSNIFANYMLGIGISKNDTVAILIDRNEGYTCTCSYESSCYLYADGAKLPIRKAFFYA